jgi:putative redox protein
MSAHVHIEVRQVSATTSEAVARQHKVLSDRPEAKGGQDQGPMGGELLLMGLGGCFMSNLLAAIRAREADIKDLRLAIAGTLSEAPMRFTAITLEVRGQYADKAEMEKLVTVAERGCIVANTLKGAVALSLTVA